MATFYWVFLNRKHQIQSPKLSQRRAEKMVSQLKKEDLRYWWAWNPSFTEWVPLANLVAFQGQKLVLTFQNFGANPSIQETTYTGENFVSEDTQPDGFLENGQIKKGSDLGRPVKKIVIEDRHQSHRPSARVAPVQSAEHLLNESDPLVFKNVDFSGDDFTWSIEEAPPVPKKEENPADRRTADRFDIRLEVLLMGHGKSFRTFSVNISMTGCMLEDKIPSDLLGKPFEVVFISRQNGEADRLAFKGKIAGSLTDPRRLSFIEQPEESREKLIGLIQRHIAGGARKIG